MPAFGRALAARIGEHVNIRVRLADELGWREARLLAPGNVLLLEVDHDPMALHWPVQDQDVLVCIDEPDLARRTCRALIVAGAELAVAVPHLFVHRREADL